MNDFLLIWFIIKVKESAYDNIKFTELADKEHLKGWDEENKKKRIDWKSY
jgi:hypothetical protein